MRIRRAGLDRLARRLRRRIELAADLGEHRGEIGFVRGAGDHGERLAAQALRRDVDSGFACAARRSAPAGANRRRKSRASAAASAVIAMPAMTASAVLSARWLVRSSHCRAWIVQGTASSVQMARARSTLKPVRWPLASRKLNGGKSSVVMKRMACTAPAGGRSMRRLGSQKSGTMASCPAAENGPEATGAIGCGWAAGGGTAAGGCPAAGGGSAGGSKAPGGTMVMGCSCAGAAAE